MSDSALFLGIDVGTSGVRAIAIDAAGDVVAESRVLLPPAIHTDNGGCEQVPELWWQGCCDVLTQLFTKTSPSRIKSVAIDATSSTVLLADKNGEPVGRATMYNDSRSQAEAERIKRVAPSESAAHGASSTLAKVLRLKSSGIKFHFVLHQADWLVGKLCGRYGLSDENNCIKLGYDAINKCWPNWLERLGVDKNQLPQVATPGTPIGFVSESICQRFNFKPDTAMIAGTTDSTAAFLATGAQEPGDAVTSLGSTLVTKVISEKPLFSPQHGVYAQPYGNNWLIGGGSSSGGAVLLHYFSSAQLAEMTPKLNPTQSTGLDYYPLIKPGERFPVNDPNLKPALSPRPTDDAVFFQGMLEGMARIEQQAYRLLETLGAPYPQTVRSAGGGRQNPVWTEIRQKQLNTKFITAKYHEAAYGSALLAKRGFNALKSIK